FVDDLLAQVAQFLEQRQVRLDVKIGEEVILGDANLILRRQRDCGGRRRLRLYPGRPVVGGRVAPGGLAAAHQRDEQNQARDARQETGAQAVSCLVSRVPCLAWCCGDADRSCGSSSGGRLARGV